MWKGVQKSLTSCTCFFKHGGSFWAHYYYICVTDPMYPIEYHSNPHPSQTTWPCFVRHLLLLTCFVNIENMCIEGLCILEYGRYLLYFIILCNTKSIHGIFGQHNSMWCFNFKGVYHLVMLTILGIILEAFFTFLMCSLIFL